MVEIYDRLQYQQELQAQLDQQLEKLIKSRACVN
jgi:hypothetical protein